MRSIRRHQIVSTGAEDRQTRCWERVAVLFAVVFGLNWAGVGALTAAPVVPPGHEAYLAELVAGGERPEGVSLTLSQIGPDRVVVEVAFEDKRTTIALVHPSEPGRRLTHFAAQVDGDVPEALIGDVLSALALRDTIDIWVAAGNNSAATFTSTAIRNLPCLSDAEADAALQSDLRDFGQVRPGALWATGGLLLLILLGAVMAVVRRGRAWLFPGGTESKVAANRWEWFAVSLLSLVTLAIYVAAASQRLNHFLMPGSDFTIYSQVLWSASEGHGLFNSNEGIDHLGSHASPFLYLLAPVYSLFPSPLTVLVLNAAFLAACVIPAWLLARRRLARGPALAVAALVAASPALAYLSVEVQAVKFAPCLLLWSLVFFERRSGWFLLFALLALSCKENVGLVVGSLGLVALMDRDTRFAGGLTFMLAALWLVCGTSVIIPWHLGEHSSTMIKFAHLGTSWSEVVASPVTRPEVFWPQVFRGDTASYLLKLLVPFGFIWLLAPRHLVVALPIMAQNILADWEVLRDPGFHYSALALPGIVWAFVIGLEKLSKRVPSRWFVVAPVACVLVSGTAGWLDDTRFWPDTSSVSAERVAAAQGVIDATPPQSSLLAPMNLQPHLATRSYAWGFDLSGSREADIELPEIVILELAGADRSDLPALTADHVLFLRHELVFANCCYEIYRHVGPPAERCFGSRSPAEDGGSGDER